MILPKYYTVKHIAQIFCRDEATIRRWITEGKRITFDGIEYKPDHDPAGNWLFKAIEIEFSSSIKKID